MSALNPNHPVTQMASENWHKLLAVLMLKLGIENIHLTEADVARMGDNQKAILMHAHADSIELKIVSLEEGARLAREHGGLPS